MNKSMTIALINKLKGTDKLVRAPSRSANEILPIARLHNSRTQMRAD